MKKKIHPEFKKINVKCSCENNFYIYSTLIKDISIEICSSCHPFFTGTQKLVDSGGRINRFKKQYLSSKKKS